MITNFKKLFFSAWVFTSLVFTQQANADYKLHILHYNDLHSRIESVSKYDGNCSKGDEAEGKCFGGVARLYPALMKLRDELKAQGENVIILDAGDQFQGSLMYTTYKGDVEAEFLQMLSPDAMAVGNHEFDDGPEGFAGFLEQVNIPVLSGNIDVSAEPLLSGKIDDHLILEIGGENIGIISALAVDTKETSSPGENVKFMDEISALKADAAALSEQGINKIIALNHVGYNKDLQIAGAIKGVDVVVGGHSHSLLSNTNDRAEGPYPTRVGNIPVVQAYAYSKYFGHLIVTFNDEGEVIASEGDTVLVDNSFPVDEKMAQRIAELAGPIEELKATVIGNAADIIDGDRNNCRLKECTMGNLVADAMLARTQSQGVQIAIQNGGGLRASIDQGEITMGELLTVLPFQNTLATFQTTGAVIVEALENGVSQIADVAGRFPQIAGLRYEFDGSVGKILCVDVMEEGEWVKLDPEITYGVVTNNYVRGGGDGYAMFRDKAQNVYDYGPNLEDVVAEFIANQGGEYTPYLDQRINEGNAASSSNVQSAPIASCS